MTQQVGKRSDLQKFKIHAPIFGNPTVLIKDNPQFKSKSLITEENV